MLEAILIAGPTASGKSTAALALAERLGGTIINADSMQVYRELRVLTARPSVAEMATAPHRLYGMVPAADAYSVGRWVGDAAAAIEDARERGQVPILVGGTGLYFMACSRGCRPFPTIPEDIRRHWRERAATAAGTELHAVLAARDPVMARASQSHRPAAPRTGAGGHRRHGCLARRMAGTAGTPVLNDKAVLKMRGRAGARDDLRGHRRAASKTCLRPARLAEVAALAGLQLDPGCRPCVRLGVRELGAYLSGAMSLEEAATKAKTESRRYAKRQMTWARRFMADWTWVPSGEPRSRVRPN